MSTGDKGASEVLGELQGKGDYYTKLSVAEKKRLLDLKDALEYINKETDKYRSLAKKVAIDVMNLHVLTPNPAYSRADGVDVGRQAKQVTLKALNILEWKLNKLLQRKSESIIENKRLKSEIDHFRRLRLQIDVSHSKYEDKLRITKDKIENYLSESSAVVEEREKYIEKKEQLERINIEEQRLFAAEYEELGMFIKSQNDALELALLNERKADRNDQKAASAILNNDPSLDAFKCDLTLDEEVAMAKQVGTLSKFMTSESNSLSGVQEKINSYEEMFEQMRKITNSNSMEDVVSTYVAAEEDMFSLYNFIQSVNADIDTQNEAAHTITLELEKFKEDQKVQEQSKINVLAQLESRLAYQLETYRVAEEQQKQLSNNVAQISKKVQSIFFKLQCDQMDNKANQAQGNKNASKGVAMSRPESKVAILAGQTVSDSNVLDFMGCIEQRAVNIISEYLHFTEPTGTARGYSKRPASPTPGPVSPMVMDFKPKVDTEIFDNDEMNILIEERFSGNSDSSAIDMEASKPVDLSLFKDKLSRKLGLDRKAKK